MIYRVWSIESNGTRVFMGDWKSEVAARRHIETMLEEEGPHGESDFEYEPISEAKKAKRGSK
jgi:hypothetical protein